MKRNTYIILILSIVSVLLSACGGASTDGVTPTADHLVEFDEQGIAVLRGQVSSLSTSDAKTGTFMNIDIPAEMDGLDVLLSVPFSLRNETILASTTTKPMDLLEYLSFNKGSSAVKAFPSQALVDVTFRKTGTGFEAISINEVTESFSLFKRTVTIEPLFSSDIFNPGTLQGRIIQSFKDSDGFLVWTLAMPIQMQGVEAAVLVPVHPGADTEIITTSGNVIMLDQVSGNVQIGFTRNRDTITAHSVTIIPTP